MVQVYNAALDKSVSVDRIINRIEGEQKGPTIVFFAGIHGNETAGVLALKEELDKLAKETKNIKGTVYGVSGNLQALGANKRYLDQDLNRMWINGNLNPRKENCSDVSETAEIQEIHGLLENILNTEAPPFYFMDLHTTSSKTLPFITINDATINRKFSRLFPVPVVLGIEEYLNGPLLSYINEMGYVSIGFESGQHDEKEAVHNAKAFIGLVLLYAGCYGFGDFPELKIHYDLLSNAADGNDEMFEVIHLHRIRDNEPFKMLHGFESFQKVKKGTVVAKSGKQDIKFRHNAHIFMPLYQKRGREGFFVIKRIRPLFLKASLILRKLKLDNVLTFLPGIKWKDKSKGILIVNLRVAKFLARPIFHLLGYRNRQLDEDHLRLNNRERTSKLEMYESEFWFKNKR